MLCYMHKKTVKDGDCGHTQVERCGTAVVTFPVDGGNEDKATGPRAHRKPVMLAHSFSTFSIS